MNPVKVYCLHPYCNDVESMIKYMCLELDGVNFEWSPKNPDYLIASERIYTNYDINKEFKKLYNSTPIVILYAKEAISPDFNLFDYAVGFDGNLMNGDRFTQLPPPFISFKRFLPQQFNDIESDEQAFALLQQKRKFCNFLYSNGNAHPIRDKMFFALSRYKRVDSLGKHLNNVGIKGTGFQGHLSDCINLKNPYKFSIACENASFLGYTSEKIFTSLAAHTVPIYWGDPEIIRNVNPDCFINCNNMTLDEMIAEVKRIDEDDKLWARMVAAPWRTQEQIEYHNKQYENYNAFFENMFTQNIESASRRPEGTYPMIVRDFFNQTRMKLIYHFLVRKTKKYIKTLIINKKLYDFT